MLPSGVVDWSPGQDAVDLAAVAGLDLDDWQVAVCVLKHGLNAGGKWAAFESGLEVGRQNGKGAITEAEELAGLFLWGQRLIIHTAHEFKTAQEAFARIAGLIESTPKLSRRVAHIRTANGDEAIELKDGARLRFLARSGGSGRGFSSDGLKMDEALRLGFTSLGAVLPTLGARMHATKYGPRIDYTSSAGDEYSEVWSALRQRAIDADAVGTEMDGACYFGWGAASPEDHDGADVDLDDEDGWRRANPGVAAGRLDIGLLRKFRAALDDEQFAREHLGVWHRGAAASVFGADVWHDLRDPQSSRQGRVRFGLDVPPGARTATIAVAGHRADDLTHIEVVDQRPGTRWAVGRCVELLDRHGDEPVVVNPAGPAGALLADLAAADVPVELLSGRDYAQACGLLLTDFTAQRLRHIGQAPLDVAAASARQQKYGKDGAWTWSRANADVDISPIVAATLALHGLRQPEPEPERVVTGEAAFY